MNQKIPAFEAIGRVADTFAANPEIRWATANRGAGVPPAQTAGLPIKSHGQVRIHPDQTADPSRLEAYAT